jgi:acyl carrier protein
VVSVSGEEQRLVAYVVPEEYPASDAERLIESYRDGLGTRLPAYMVPTAYIVMERLPLTPNGKVDRKKLPAPAEQDLHTAVYVAPRNEVEATLCVLWQEILRVEQVGVDDSFFALGGHSLLAVRVISRIREAFQVELPVRTLFEKLTVGTLAVEVMEHLIATKSAENQQRMMLSDDAEEEIL